MTDSSRTSKFGNLKQNLSRFVRSPHVTQVPATTRTSTPAHPASYHTPTATRLLTSDQAFAGQYCREAT